MKRTVLMAALSAALLAFPIEAFAQSDEAVKQAYAAWDEAFNRQDAQGIAATYDAEAVLLPPSHEVIEGSDKVQTFFEGVLKAGTTDHKLELVEVMDRGDTVVAAARWSAKGKNAEGKAEDWGGLATHVFKKDGDDLKLILHSFN
ncbi:YybH family protein [Chthonobacter rhizosphaerae]|uniref:YybH family protein n=1 Tax=Chthonobacter rhizosphaerae TaxID=2735553 RepID=UPI001FE6F508|nr:DUF4440 domain-containing protein [Chthonobacter rhizosphaerae]